MTLLPTIFLCVGLLAGVARADDRLSVGDNAPALTIEHFVKGERVDDFPADKVTVVEFWATWCKPCIVGFPHLSELQEKYADELVIIGVSDESLEVVEPFLAKPKHGDVTRYRMATDPDGSMQAAWMTAAQQRGIPCAFIVDREGIVQYIGHPMGMDRALERVITGKGPESSDAPAMSAEQRAAMFTVEGTHSPEAASLLTDLRDSLSAPGGVVSFEQELLLPGAIRMGGPDGEALDLRKSRKGELVLGGDRGDRLDATRIMHLPGMPEGMGETETMLFEGDRLLVKFVSGSPFMPSPLPTDGWTQILRAEAQALAEEQPVPIPFSLVMSVSPALASPLDALDTLLDMSALEVVLDEGGSVVLAGPAAPMAGVPTPPEDGGMSAMSEAGPSQLRLEFERAGGGSVTILVGDPEAPSLSMRLERRELEAEPDASLFDIGDKEPAALLPILREQMEAMAGMEPPK